MSSMSSECQNQNDTGCEVEILQAVAYAPLFVFGLLLNATALWAFVRRRHVWTDTHVYMLNLTLADLTLVAFLPFRIADAVLCLRPSYLCTFLISVHYVNMYASVLTTTALSVHRFLLVRFPHRYRRGNKARAAVVCAFIWAVVAAVCVAFRRDNYPERLRTCFERRRDDPIRPSFLALLCTVGFFVPLLVVVCCSSQIVYTLTRASDYSREKRGIVSIVTANMATFVFCYTPIHASFLLNYSGTAPETCSWPASIVNAHRFLLVSEWIATTNCCLDSVGYYFLFKSLSSKGN